MYKLSTENNAVLSKYKVNCKVMSVSYCYTLGYKTERWLSNSNRNQTNQQCRVLICLSTCVLNLILSENTSVGAWDTQQPCADTFILRRGGARAVSTVTHSDIRDTPTYRWGVIFITFWPLWGSIYIPRGILWYAIIGRGLTFNTLRPPTLNFDWFPCNVSTIKENLLLMVQNMNQRKIIWRKQLLRNLMHSLCNCMTHLHDTLHQL